MQYNTDRGLIFEEIETKYYYQKNSEDKDFNLEIKGILNTTFSEFTITMFSKVYDTYSRSYKKGPQLLAEIGGVINSLYIMATILNYYIDKKLKEADIFNICCSDSLKDLNQEKSHFILQKNDVKSTETIIRSNSNYFISTINMLNNTNIQKGNETNILYQGQDISDNSKNMGKKDDTKKVIQNNYIDKKSLSENNVSNKLIRFKSVIFDKGDSLNLLINVEYSIIEILFPCKRKALQKEKMDLAEKFSDQLFDIHFLFGNVLDTQINFKNMFESNKS